jgi:hypothetical protein
MTRSTRKEEVTAGKEIVGREGLKHAGDHEQRRKTRRS